MTKACFIIIVKSKGQKASLMHLWKNKNTPIKVILETLKQRHDRKLKKK